MSNTLVNRMTKMADEIMAEYLLNGGKMLSEMCPKCGAPFFEVNGCKECVVCAEREKEEVKTVNVQETALKQEAKITQIKPLYAQDSLMVPTPELDVLLSTLIARAIDEKDSSKCLVLTECIRTVAEAKTMLVRLP